MKYAACSGAVRWSGGLQVLKAGQSIPDEHPLVAERPELFTDTPPEADIKMPAQPSRTMAPPVESATRAPGERRSTRAPRPGKGKGGQQ